MNFFVFKLIFCYTNVNCFPLIFFCMANAFIPQSSDASTSTETAAPDLFNLNEAPSFTEVPPDTEPPQERELPSPEQPEQSPFQTKTRPSSQKAQVHPHPSTLYTPKDPMISNIEKIMEEGIADAYQELTAIQKQQFKIKGEETARAIKKLLKETKVKVKKVFELLFEWLKLLPGINRFFLMQEAKIKTDKIIALHAS